MPNPLGIGGRPPAPWRITGAHALQRIEDGERVDSVAAAAGVSDTTLRRYLHLAGWIITRWPIDHEDIQANYKLVLRYHRVIHAAQLDQLHTAMDRAANRDRGDYARPIEVPWSAVARRVGIAASAAPSIADAVSRWRSHQDALRHGGGRSPSAEPLIMELPGKRGSLIDVDPDRADHVYNRSGQASRPGRRSQRLRITTKDMISMYQDKSMGLREIGEAAGASPATIARRLREYGVPIRTVGRRKHG